MSAEERSGAERCCARAIIDPDDFTRRFSPPGGNRTRVRRSPGFDFLATEEFGE
jgi:hypothetical protein